MLTWYIKRELYKLLKDLYRDLQRLLGVEKEDKEEKAGPKPLPYALPETDKDKEAVRRYLNGL